MTCPMISRYHDGSELYRLRQSLVMGTVRPFIGELPTDPFGPPLKEVIGQTYWIFGPAQSAILELANVACGSVFAVAP